MRAITGALAAALALGAAPAIAGDTPSEPGTEVFIINLEDGATLSAPVLVQFGLSGMGIAPAGIEQAGTGHHHIFLDREPFDPASEANEIIPADDNHIHYGGGQTQTELDLAPGEHTLQLVFGDYEHVPHDPPVYSQPITVTVE